VERRRTQSRDDVTHFELIIRFTAWAYQLNRFPSEAQIRAHLDVSRATAYRWRDAFVAAHGIGTPENCDENDLL
jgi:hypothetical protein